MKQPLTVCAGERRASARLLGGFARISNAHPEC
jgi:hypothetical protein